MTRKNLQKLAQPHLDAGQIVVMGGFIGSTEGGITTTLAAEHRTTARLLPGQLSMRKKFKSGPMSTV
jgi:hypothetical protein